MLQGLAWNYLVNGKPSLAWGMQRRAVRTDKASSIGSDGNEHAVETMTIRAIR